VRREQTLIKFSGVQLTSPDRLNDSAATTLPLSATPGQLRADCGAPAAVIVGAQLYRKGLHTLGVKLFRHGKSIVTIGLFAA
jgi:hypothetical protein